MALVRSIMGGFAMGTRRGTLGILLALASGCGSSGESADESVPENDAPLRGVEAARSSTSPSIEVEKIEGGFVVKNTTASPIVCGVVGTLGVTPRQTMRVAARDTARIDDRARSIVACKIDIKTAAEIAGETEEEWRRALGVSSEQAKLLIFEQRGTTSSSTVMLESSCEPEAMDDSPRTQAGLK